MSNILIEDIDRAVKLNALVRSRILLKEKIKTLYGELKIICEELQELMPHNARFGQCCEHCGTENIFKSLTKKNPTNGQAERIEYECPCCKQE